MSNPHMNPQYPILALSDPPTPAVALLANERAFTANAVTLFPDYHQPTALVSPMDLANANRATDGR
jgi:hypothetical protein